MILLVALLGAAGLLARSNQMEMETYQRVQALTLLQDMAARLNANRRRPLLRGGIPDDGAGQRLDLGTGLRAGQRRPAGADDDGPHRSEQRPLGSAETSGGKSSVP